jgi:hypothetical protein
MHEHHLGRVERVPTAGIIPAGRYLWSHAAGAVVTVTLDVPTPWEDLLARFDAALKATGRQPVELTVA